MLKSGWTSTSTEVFEALIFFVAFYFKGPLKNKKNKTILGQLKEGASLTLLPILIIYSSSSYYYYYFYGCITTNNAYYYYYYLLLLFLLSTCDALLTTTYSYYYYYLLLLTTTYYYLLLLTTTYYYVILFTTSTATTYTTSIYIGRGSIVGRRFGSSLWGLLRIFFLGGSFVSSPELVCCSGVLLLYSQDWRTELFSLDVQSWGVAVVHWPLFGAARGDPGVDSCRWGRRFFSSVQTFPNFSIYGIRQVTLESPGPL